MSLENQYKTILYKGTSQQARDHKELQGTYFEPDERSIADFIRFAQRYSEELRYYDSNNAHQGDWSAFLKYDASAILAMMAANEPEDYISYFDDLMARSDSKTNLKHLFDFTIGLLHQIDSCYQRSKGFEPFELLLGNLIRSQLKVQLEWLLLSFKSASTKNLISTGVATDVDTIVPLQNAQTSLSLGFSPIWLPDLKLWPDYLAELDGSRNDFIFGDSSATPTIQRGRAKEYLKLVGQQLLKIYSLIVQIAGEQLENSLANYPEHQPHVALFLAFLKLYQYLQADLNQFSKRHLDYYYKEVLQLEKRLPEANMAHLVIELAKQEKAHLIANGSNFSGPKDGAGEDVFYKLEEEAAINKASIDGLKSVLAERNTSGELQKLSMAAIANSDTGQEEGLTSADQSWSAFHTAEQSNLNSGFALASNNLLLEDGQREVTLSLTLQFSNVPAAQLNELHAANASTYLQSIFEVAITVEDEWLTLDNTNHQIDLSFAPNGVDSKIFKISFKLGTDDPAFVALTRVHGAHFTEGLPHARVILRNDMGNRSSEIERFLLKSISLLSDARISLFESIVHVAEKKAIVVRTGSGIVDPSGPFSPFGPFPSPGKSFSVQSDELIGKKISEATAQLEWESIPESGIAPNNRQGLNASTDSAIYNKISKAPKLRLSIGQQTIPPLAYLFHPYDFRAYQDAQDIVIFEVPDKLELFPFPNVNSVAKLFQANATNRTEAKQLIETMGTALIMLIFSSGFPVAKKWEMALSVWNFGQFMFQKIDDTPDWYWKTGSIPISWKPAQPVLVKKDTQFSAEISQGDFAHSHFTKRFATASIAKDASKIPNPPYEVKAKSVYLNYEAQSSFDLSTTSEQAQNVVYQISAFGQVKAKDNSATLLPKLPVNGEWYIGLTDLLPPQTISILFQVAEGSANPLAGLPSIEWSYLSQEGWTTFANTDIQDATNQLSQSGIITFSVPEEAVTDNPLLPVDQHWLRASILNHRGLNRIIQLHPQAVLVKFEDNDNDPDFLSGQLPAGEISKQVNKERQVKSVDQPYATFGGRPTESDEDFYKRSSERLRHKNRAISIWDYEHLILEEFPEIYKVKCLRTLESISNGQQLKLHKKPGHITIALIPDLRQLDNTMGRLPRVSTAQLEKIKGYVETLSSPFAKIEVINPVFEAIKVTANVTYHAGKDITLHDQKLKEAIYEYLSPWAFDSEQAIEFGGIIYKSTLINFVEELPYVDFITAFQMDHLEVIEQDGLVSYTVIEENVEKVQGRGAASVLVAANA